MQSKHEPTLKKLSVDVAEEVKEEKTWLDEHFHNWHVDDETSKETGKVLQGLPPGIMDNLRLAEACRQTSLPVFKECGQAAYKYPPKNTGTVLGTLCMNQRVAAKANNSDNGVQTTTYMNTGLKLLVNKVYKEISGKIKTALLAKSSQLVEKYLTDWKKNSAMYEWVALSLSVYRDFNTQLTKLKEELAAPPQQNPQNPGQTGMTINSGWM